MNKGSATTSSFIFASRERGEIYIGDAADYITSGAVFCYGYDGRKKWKQTSGVVPAAAAARQVSKIVSEYIFIIIYAFKLDKKANRVIVAMCGIFG